MKTYLKFLSRNKLYTAIEFIGLSVALAFVIISFCYVVQQYAVTRENPDRERIYAVGPEKMTNSYGMKEIIDGKLPEVEAVTHFHIQEKQKIRIGEQLMNGNLLNCDREFFDFFPVRFKEGNADQMTEAKVGFVSERLANQIEGEIIGRQIIVGMDTLNVVGIVSDLGSSLLPDWDIIGNIAVSRNENRFRQNAFNMFTLMPTLIRVHPNTNRELLAQKLKGLYVEPYQNYKSFGEPHLIRLDEIYFSEVDVRLHQGDKAMLRTMIIVGLLLLFSALINYINLNVALTGKRAKEMASRRLLGAQKSDIVLKFLGEAFFFTLCCFAVGLAIAHAITPAINRLLASDVPIEVPLRVAYLLAYLLMVVVVSLLAGFLPSAIISQARPIDVVKGTFRFRTKKTLSRIFIVVQNVIVVILIALVLTMELQMRHMVERPMGLNLENLYFIRSDMDRSPLKGAFIDELRALPFVKEIGSTNTIPGVKNETMGLRPKDRDEQVMCNVLFCDSVAFRLFGIELLEKFKEPQSNSFYMTETTFAAMTGLPYGNHSFEAVQAWGDEFFKNDICGVVKDFNMLDALHATDEDLCIIFAGDWSTDLNNPPLLEITGDHKEAKRAIDALLKKHLEQAFGVYLEPKANDFVENVIAKQYDKTLRQMRLIEIILAVSVLLALLGLVAMSTHFASEREKTIAIRKVFGGTMQSEIRRNLKEYIIMILIANAIAIPVAVWLCKRYLEDFAYRIDLHPWIFVVTVALSFVIAIGSVLWQIVSVARVNPVMALKKE
jgi:putative ABC transport system permease protein